MTRTIPAIHCVYRKKSENEVAFTGFMQDHQGHHIGTVSGTLGPVEWLTVAPSRRGRPMAAEKHVSVEGHMCLAELICSDEFRIKKARVQVAELLNIGCAPENQDRQVRDHCAKASGILKETPKILVVPGDKNGTGWLIMYLETLAKVEIHQGILGINGYGWILQWGDRAATHGLIKGEGKIDQD